ncbi:hypothetical protein ABBQ38_008347 [Trebouxia sp. C0009 RCD-2024]
MQQQAADPAQAWVPRPPDVAAWFRAGGLHTFNELPHQAWLSMLRLLSYVQLPQLLGLLVIIWLVRYALKARYKTESAHQRARWQQVLDSQQQFTVAESFTLGWLNVLLRHLWPTVLEKEISDKATDSLRETITKILKTSGEKAPLKYVESIKIEEFTMGMQPPRFHFCHARYNPTRNYLQFEADMGFRSSGFQLVVAPSMRAHALLPRVSGRVAVTHLNVAGRMLIGFHLFSRAPGIKGVDVSFLHPPEIDVKFSPFGMTVTEIPGILNALKDKMQKSMSKDMVEPKRKYIDVESTWKKHLLNKAAGPGGLLIVTMVQARDLRYRGMTMSNMKQIDAYCELRYGTQVFRTPCVRGSGNPAWNWQFEVSLTAPQGGQGPGAHGECQLKVLDAKALGDPGVLGTADISLADAQLQPNAGPRDMWLPLKGSPEGTIHVQVTLLAKEALGQPGLAATSDARLQAALGQAGKGEIIQTGKPARGVDVVEDKAEFASLLEAEKSRRRLLEQRFSTAEAEADKLRNRLKELQGINKKTKAGQQRAEDKVEQTRTRPHGARPLSMQTTSLSAEPAERGPDRMPAGAGKQLAQSQNTATADPQGDQGKSDGILGSLRDDGTALLEESARKQGESDGDQDDGTSKSDGDHLLSSSADQALAVERAGAAKGAYAGVKQPSPTMGNQPGPLALLVKVSKLERVLKEEKAGRERQVAELEAYAAQLEDELELEHRRRLNEQLCALIEGAPFIMYKSSEVSERHVWFSVATHTLRWAMTRTAVPGSAKVHRNGDTKNKERSIDVKKILKVETGTGMFPGSNGAKGWEQLKSIIPFGAARKPSDASTGPEEDRSFTLVFIGNSTMHLAVKGNGRSRNEWVAAFSDLASGLYADILKPDEPTGKAE